MLPKIAPYEIASNIGSDLTYTRATDGLYQWLPSDAYHIATEGAGTFTEFNYDNHSYPWRFSVLGYIELEVEIVVPKEPTDSWMPEEWWGGAGQQTLPQRTPKKAENPYIVFRIKHNEKMTVKTYKIPFLLKDIFVFINSFKVNGVLSKLFLKAIRTIGRAKIRISTKG